MNTEARRISTVDTCKLIRKDLAEFFPGIKFSVTTKHYGSIDIRWTDGPTQKTVSALTDFYQCQSYDGMTENSTYYNRYVKGEEVHFCANYVMEQRTESNEFIAAMLPMVCKKYGQEVPAISYDKWGRIEVGAWDNGPVCGRDTLRDLVMQACYATDSRHMAESASPANKFREIAETVAKEIEDKRRDHSWNLTARRANIESGLEADARQLEKLQDKLLALATKWDEGYLTESLRRVNSRVLVEQLLGGHFPNAQTQPAEFKRLVAAGLSNDDAFRHAAFELSLLGDAEIGKPTAADALRELEVKVTLSKIDGFFPTPQTLAERMVQEADIREGMSILEPSAGKGDIVAQIPGKVDVIESNLDLRKILEIKGFNLLFQCYDFLEFDVSNDGGYDRILMNPPFENMQDVDHVRHAYYYALKDGGRLVAIMSESPFFRSDAKATTFRAWLEEVGGTSEKLPDGTFKDSDRPTGVATRLVIIDKPAPIGSDPGVSTNAQSTPPIVPMGPDDTDVNFATPEPWTPIKTTEPQQEIQPMQAQTQPELLKIVPRESDAETTDSAEVKVCRDLIDENFKRVNVVLNDALPLVDNKAALYKLALRWMHESWGAYGVASTLTKGHFVYEDFQLRAQTVIDLCWAAL